MTKIFSINVVAALLVVAGSGPALADQLTLGGSSQTIYFCSTGAAGTPIELSTTVGCATPGGTVGSATSGSFESPTGTTVLAIQPWSFVFPTTAPVFEFGGLSGDDFTPVVNGASITFNWGDPTHRITGNVTFTLVTDHTSTPRFRGTLDVTANANGSCAGSICAALATDYQVGSISNFDFTANLGTNPLLEDIYNHVGGTSTSGTISSGEVPNAPEPGAIFLYGTGMLLAGTIVRYRRRHQA